jgi:hypothetical protein
MALAVDAPRAFKLRFWYQKVTNNILQFIYVPVHICGAERLVRGSLENRIYRRIRQ